MFFVLRTEAGEMYSSALKLGRCTVCAIDLGHVIYVYIPYYRKLTLHEIKVLEINAT